MEKWRFLEVGWLTYAETAIYRPVLMRARSEGIVPDTVSFCTFPKPSMITTFFNDPEKDINLDLCRERKITVFRTIASGGPIFGDTGYVFTFLHIARENPRVPPNAEKMFEKTLTGIAAGISEYFNVECRFRPLNDVEVKCQDGVWRKIGPSSCFYEDKAIQMGSGIQVKKPDADLIASAITPPVQKFQDKQASTVHERITYLEHVVGRSIDLNEIKEIYIRQIEKIFEIQLVPGKLTDLERGYYKEMEEGYTSDEFFMERSERRFGTPPSDAARKMLEFKVAEGPMVRIITFVRDNRIWNLLISGSIHASPLRPTSPIHEIEKALKGQPIDQRLFESRIDEILNRPNFNFAKVSAELLASKIYECATAPPLSPSPLGGGGKGWGGKCAAGSPQMEEKISLLSRQIEKLCQLRFYRNKLDESGIKPSRIKTLDDFKKVPFTLTSEIVEELKRKPSECSLYTSDVTRVNFSPSGQELYPVYQTSNDLKKMHEVCARTLKAAGVKKGDICIVTYGYHLFIAGLFYQSQLEYYGAKVIPLGPGESERAINLINKYEVPVLITNPTFALKLASGGIPSVRILFVGGEPFTSVEGYTQRMQNAFGRDLTIIDSYSMALCMPVARSCRYGTGLHIMDDFIFIEVIDPLTGENVAEGERGELVITHLYKEASPLLRYRTGDLTFMIKEKCECGRETTLPKGVIGRTDEMLKVKGVKFWPSQISTIVRGFPGCRDRYQVLVRSKNGVDVLELVVEGEKLPENTVEELSKRLKQETLLAFDRIEIVEQLQEGPLVVDEREGRTF